MSLQMSTRRLLHPRTQARAASPALLCFFAVLLIQCALCPASGAVDLKARKATNTKINEIQGTNYLSTFVGQTISNVTGISTYVALADPTKRGFTTIYLQSLAQDYDQDIRTSEGIRVFCDNIDPASVTVGCIIELTNCVVEEYRSSSNALSVTGLLCRKAAQPSGNMRIVQCQQKLPEPLVLGAGSGGRSVPQESIRFDTSSPSIDIETLNPVLDPESYALDFYESVEGMFVKIDDPRVVGPINSYKELFVVPDNGDTSPYLNSRSSLVLMTGDGSGWSPQCIRVTLDSSQSYESMSTNDRFSGAFIGPLDYRFSYFTILPQSPLPTHVRYILPKGIAPLLGSSYLRVASYNVLNLNPKCGTRCDELAYHIVVNMGSPDIIALQEVHAP